MKAVIREQIVEQLMRLPAIVDQYLAHDSHFIGNTLRWMRETEEKLQSSRLPIVSEISTLRGLIAATDEGYTEPHVVTAQKSSRKTRRVMVMHLLRSAEQTLREQATQIDREFDDFKDKLSQLLAVASAKKPLPAPKAIDTLYLDKVWALLKDSPENKNLYFYLQARLPETDRRYLLQDLLHHLLQPGGN
ncbi:hypothetical protein [Marinimicrobium locisalis]|uniref:hypothetical protein n=1 Tax=Marinimicrobium locisalis TaxID=546022 RepID=UPI0032218588